MAHFIGPAEKREAPTAATARNARYGLVLFAIYLAFYVAFVALVAFAAERMRTEIAGVNVAIVYGLGLILAAFILAVIYLWLCKVRE